MIFQVALCVEALTTAIFRADKRLFTAMNAHVDHKVLADAEYFSAIEK